MNGRAPMVMLVIARWLHRASLLEMRDVSEMNAVIVIDEEELLLLRLPPLMSEQRYWMIEVMTVGLLSMVMMMMMIAVDVAMMQESVLWIWYFVVELSLS
jgi:hypothetical protein